MRTRGAPAHVKVRAASRADAHGAGAAARVASVHGRTSAVAGPGAGSRRVCPLTQAWTVILIKSINYCVVEVLGHARKIIVVFENQIKTAAGQTQGASCQPHKAHAHLTGFPRGALRWVGQHLLQRRELRVSDTRHRQPVVAKVQLPADRREAHRVTRTTHTVIGRRTLEARSGG